MAASLSGVFSLQEFTDLGAPLVGGRVYTYAQGTTTHKTAYTDKAGSIAHTYTSDGIGGQYIGLNARGELPASLYLAAGSYDITLKDSTGATIWTRRADPVEDAIRSDLASTSGASKGAGMVGFDPTLNYLAGTIGTRFKERISITDFPWLCKGDDSTDNTSALNAVYAWATANDVDVFVPGGIFRAENVMLQSNVYTYGVGMGVSVLKIHKASNPGAQTYIATAARRSNIRFEKLTISSNAYADGLFNVGTYTAGPPKKYSNGDQGKISGILISSCSNVTFDTVEITGFNQEGVRLDTEGTASGDYNTNVQFLNCYGHHCLTTPVSIGGTKGFKVVGGVYTDNGNFAANYVDGSTGYGVVLGRTCSASDLRSSGGECYGVFSARNARHGIDVHAGANIHVHDNILEDNLIMGVCYMDIPGSGDDSLVGEAKVVDNVIYHTAWVESKYPLLTYRDDGSERDDSIPIFVSRVGSTLLQAATVTGNTVRDWRYRQLTANTTTDLVGPIIVSVVNHAKVNDNTVEALNTSYLPSFGLQLESRTFECDDNTWVAKQRSTVSKGFYVFDADNEGQIDSNHFELQNVYSDAGVTQAAYPTFDKTAGSITFCGNTIVQTTQGNRGPLIKTAFTNHYYGFNGVWASNVGNTIKLNGVTTMEYASRINGSLSIYISSTGAGQYDGMSSAHSYVANTATALLNIISDMPRCDGGLTINCVDNVSLGGTGVVTIPQWQDDITFAGNSADTANSMTKTGGITTTGAGLIVCPDRSNNINFIYLYLKSAGSVVVQSPANVQYCAVEATAAAGIGLLCYYKASYVRNTRFKGPGGTSQAIQAALGGRVISQSNDSDAAQFAYGLVSNSAAIYKNSTQPTGSTANELTQNGGTIA